MATFLITGASRGIGAALTRAARERGHRVIETVRAGGASPDTLVMDVTSTESVRAARAACTATAIDVLVNNAGMTGGPQRAPGMDLARAEQIMSVNALGPLRVYDAFADLLRLGRGLLVNVSSEAGSLGAFRASSKPEYGMSKAALNALTLWIAARDPDVLPVSIHPGWTRTATGGEDAPQSAEECAATLLDAIDRLGPEHRGGFFDASLQRLAW